MARNRVQGTQNRNKRTKAAKTKQKNTGVGSSQQQLTKQTNTDRKDGASTKRSSAIRTGERNFNLVVDRVPYLIKSIPVLFNEELRFRIIINNDAEHLFTWDSQIKMLRAIDDDASDLPDRLEEAISQKLQNQLK